MDFPPSATLADVGEFAAIAAISERLEPGELVYTGPGDDAAVLRTPKGHVLVSTDLLVEGRHFRRDWASATDIGRRAVAASLSDINAMGGSATGLTVGLAAPGDLPMRWLLDLTDGMSHEAASVGASLIGGDLTDAPQVMLAVTVLGQCLQAPVLRSGAGPGDVLALAGRQGWAAAGLAVLARGFRSPRAVVTAYQRPEPPYAAGPAAAEAGATAMIDVSDGLLADVRHIAVASQVHLDVDSATLPVGEPLRAVGAALGTDPLGFVLTGGDDHALAATFPEGADLPEGFLSIGQVTGKGEPGTVTVDGSAYDGPLGHEHFRR